MEKFTKALVLFVTLAFIHNAVLLFFSIGMSKLCVLFMALGCAGIFFVKIRFSIKIPIIILVAFADLFIATCFDPVEPLRYSLALEKIDSISRGIEFLDKEIEKRSVSKNIALPVDILDPYSGENLIFRCDGKKVTIASIGPDLKFNQFKKFNATSVIYLKGAAPWVLMFGGEFFRRNLAGDALTGDLIKEIDLQNECSFVLSKISLPYPPSAKPPESVK